MKQHKYVDNIKEKKEEKKNDERETHGNRSKKK